MIIQVSLDPLDSTHQLGDTLESVVLALNGHHDLGRGNESVEREKPQRRGTVEKDVVNPRFLDILSQRPLHSGLTAGLIDEFQFRGGKVDRGGEDVQIRRVGRLDGEVLDPFSTKQYLVGSRGSRVMFDAESSGCVALWIDVNHKHVEATKSEGGSDVHGRGRLPDTALLVGDHENAGFFRARQR